MNNNAGLFVRRWKPDSGPHAVICLVHGIGEHSGRYEYFAEVLTHAGYPVLTFDLRGHGKSPGQRGHVPGTETFLDEITGLLEFAFRRYADIPCFLYGFSMGGGLVLEYALRKRPPITGVILAGPSLRPPFKTPTWKIMAAKILNWLWPSLTSAHPEMEGHLGAHRKFGRDQGMRKILPQACG